MNEWRDFELLDAGNGEKIERWGNYFLRRPDPRAIWPLNSDSKIDALYRRSSKGGGEWLNVEAPESWQITYPSLAGNLTFNISLMGFKHTGLFPEQAVNWNYMQNLIMARKEKQPEQPIRVLNLFAYTGGASVACAMAGADEVVHVDAAKRINNLAKLNVQSCKLQNKYIRFITEDVNKFVDRELRRGRKYECIIMDPPAYGRGPSGEIWQLENSIYSLIDKCRELLSDSPIFLILNAYSDGLSAGTVKSLLELTVATKLGGQIEALELTIPASYRNIVLPCGFTGRWIP